MTLVMRDALLLADMLTDENSGEVDSDAVHHLVCEAGGHPTTLRRAYDQVYRRWTVNGSQRDELACLLLRRAQLAAMGNDAAGDASNTTAAEPESVPATGIFDPTVSARSATRREFHQVTT